MVFGFLGSEHGGHGGIFEFFGGCTCCAVAASGTHHDGACAVAGDKRGVEQAGVEDPRHGARVTTFRDGRCAL